MNIVCISQVYNEEDFIGRNLSNIYDLVDRIIITEGRLTPFGKLPKNSTDRTRSVIRSWIKENDSKNKVRFIDAHEGQPHSREQAEGANKRHMIKHSDIEHGDLIYCLDADEFFPQDALNDIFNMFRKYDHIKHIPVEEYQFAYSLNWYFDAEHNGRFIRYHKDGKYTTTNHFVYPDGKDVTKDYEHLRTREKTRMCHLCWAKHPELIKQKVLSFNRPSFTSWYNNVYLMWPIIPEQAYKNNSQIPPYFGKGFAEGQHTKLQEFNDNLRKCMPECIKETNIDWIDYIVNNREKLKI